MSEAIEKLEEPQEPQTSQEPPKTTTRWSGRRRRKTRFKMPKHVAVPVRGLWESAGEEERKRAHQAGVAILELWMGQASRKEVAARLEVPVLRVWQLSQQALSGLVAGLLKQPRSRGKVEKHDWEESPWKLRAKIAKLEREVESLRSLVDLLRAFPVHRETRREKEVNPVRTSTKKARYPRNTPKGNRKTTAGSAHGKKRARSRVPSTRSDGANREKLDEEHPESAASSGATRARRSDPLSSGGGSGTPAKAAGKEGGVASDR